MEIVLVRHGQTAANVKRIHQFPEEPLSERGKQQVADVVPGLAAWQPTHIIASPYQRTQTTAEIIAQAVDLPIERIEEFRELRRPFSLYGSSRYNFASIRYILRWFTQSMLHRIDIWNGESYQSFRIRLERARSILEQYPPDARVVVVSHAIFINFFVAHACNNKPMTLWQAVWRFMKVLTLKNAQLTYMSFSQSGPGTCAWQEQPTPSDVQTKA